MHQFTQHYFHLKSELHELYVSISLRTFAINIIRVFIPIYLLILGYSLQTTLIFFAVWRLTQAFMSLPAAKIASKIGLKHLIMLSVPFTIIFYLLLHFIKTVEWFGLPINIVAFIGGISSAFFWTGHHAEFAKSIDEGKTGREIGYLKILVALFTSIGPLTGAFLLTFFSFNIVFIIVTILMVSSIIPMIISDDRSESFRFSFKDFNESFKVRDVVGHTGFGLESPIQEVIWPVFIFYFILGESLVLLGLVTTVSLISSLAITFFIANNIDKKPNFFNDWGAIITSIVWFVKSFVRTGLHVFVIDSISGLSRTAQNISFNTICYDKARKERTLQYITFREFIINFSSAAVFLFMSFISINSLSMGLIIGSVGSLMYLFYRA